MGQLNQTLWNISEGIIDLENLINDLQESEDLSDSDKEVQINQLFSEWLNVEAQFDEKAEQVARYIKYLEALTEARKAEAKRIKMLAESSENQAEKLREYLVKEMQRLNKSKIEGVTCKLSMRKKPPRVCLNVNPDELPPEFQRVKIEANLTEIRKALKGKKPIDWAFFSENQEYSLMIK